MKSDDLVIKKTPSVIGFKKIELSGNINSFCHENDIDYYYFLLKDIDGYPMQIKVTYYKNDHWVNEVIHESHLSKKLPLFKCYIKRLFNYKGPPWDI